MYLSRLKIDTKNYCTLRAMQNLEVLHGMVERSFSGPRQRNLWRLDQLNESDYILLLSKVPPDTKVLAEQIGFPEEEWETKSYDSLLNRIKKGTYWRFRLNANPTTKVSRGKGKRGKVKAITINARQKEYLERQSAKYGFDLIHDQYEITRSEWKTFKKGKKMSYILSVTYEGILQVTDADQFCDALINGIGREKAYGMGLLTVMSYE